MKIKALAPWFGGKRNLAPLIVQELGEHRAYWEPFCGSMAVLLAKPQSAYETVNDLHSQLINLARVLQNPSAGVELCRKLRRTIMHEDFFTESNAVVKGIERGEITDMDWVEMAYHYFVVSWCGRNGTAGQSASRKGTYCHRYTANGGHAARRWQNVVLSIPSWRRRMRNVVIMRRDGFEVLERIPDEDGTAIYCDPPYLQKSTAYLHDFTSEDHGRLAILLRRFQKTRVVVSYYEHPALKDLYPGWTVVRREVSKAMSHVKRGENKATATEVLLINGPSCTQTQGTLLEGLA